MTQTQWGRKETVIFPPHSPIYTYSVSFFSLIITGFCVYLHFAYAMTPLQRFYLPYYLRTDVAVMMHNADKYQLLSVADAEKHIRPATETDVQEGSTPSPEGKPISLELSDQARRSGLVSLYRQPKTEYLNKPLHDYFERSIYDGESLWAIFRLPVMFGISALILQLPCSIRKDIKRRKQMKYGRRLKGPVLVSPREFNKAIQGDGIGFKTLEVEPMMRIPQRSEGQHIELMGDTGAGKTTLIMQLLRQIQARGQSAIVYDPACEFVQRFYDKDRQDTILNALDKRCQFATAVYQSALTYRLSQLGYEIEPGKSGAPEIKGYSREYLDASSPRSQQIREYLEKRGFEGHEAAQIAAHSTRDKKQILSPGEVLSAHRKLAEEYGNQADKVVSEAKTRCRSNEFQTARADRTARAHEAVSYARDRSFEREAVTDERALFRDALRRGMGEVTYPEIRTVFESRVSKGEFQLVPNRRHETGRQFTTSKTIEAEKDVIQQMTRGQSQGSAIMPIHDAVRLTEEHPHLNSAQRTAVEQVLVSQDQIQGIQGVAGSGKTTALDVIRQGAEANGYVVEGFAPTSRAAQQLRDSGIRADTLQGFLARGGQEQFAGDPERKHLYMLDESSLASTKQMRDFLERIGSVNKVVLIGDTQQHLAVDAGKPFEQLQKAGMRTAQLDQIIRQKDPELLKAVEHLSKRETVLGIAVLQQYGCVTQIVDPQQRFEAIAKSYASQPDGPLIVSPDNASRRDINQAVRNELQAHGLVSKKESQYSVLVPRSEMTGADRGWATQYEIGDVLRYQRGSKELGMERGSYAQVVATEPAVNQISVQKPTGDVVTYDPSRLRGVDTYRELERSFAVGDRIQMTAPFRDLDLPNRALGTIEQIADGEISIRMNNGTSVLIIPSEFRHFDHGYAVTSHSAQGLTAERVLVNMDTEAHPELINKRFAYVSVSRASHSVEIFTDNASRLGERLSHDVTKSSATDHSKQKSPEEAQSQRTATTPRTESRFGLSL